MKHANNDAPQGEGLIRAPSGSLAPLDMDALISRALQDLAGGTEAEELFSQALMDWNTGDYESAVALLAQCVESDPRHATPYFYLGLASYKGLGVPAADSVQAAKFWRKAAELGHAQAQNNLGVLCEQLRCGNSFSEVVFWYSKAAEQGYAAAQFNLGVLYELGRGVPQDYAQAAVWYQKAAAQGHTVAQFNLGGLYRLGRGVRQNYAQAVWWYKKAAEQGHAEAQYNLGALSTLGYGMRRDLREATAWFQRAAAQGDELAQQALETLSVERDKDCT
jgi:TPR repeat protein